MVEAGAEYRLQRSDRDAKGSRTRQGEAMNDGGTAFPKQPIFGYPHGATSCTEQGGMTLRDWFAGQAMCVKFGPRGTTMEFASLAESAYLLADAMLKAREAK